MMASETFYKITKVIYCILFLSTMSACLTTMSKEEKTIWANSFDPKTGERFIPVELWGGGSWNGDRELDRTPSLDHTAIRDNLPSSIYIEGPLIVLEKEYGNCSKFVYSRKNIHPRKGNYKTQYFQVNIDENGRKGGIGRCWEIRNGDTRQMNEFSKFPIGYWKEGERFRGIEIIDLGTPEDPCLTFQWRSEGYYTYCPGRGMVSGDGV